MKTRWMILALVCCLPTLALSQAQEQLSLSPGQALQRLKDGNDRFAADMMEPKDVGAKKRLELAKGQRPIAAILSCADSRLPPELIFNQGLGELFVVRVAGNISDPFVVGSVDYAVAQLKVPLIVVLGHEDCGAVRAAMGKDRPGGNLGKLLDEIDIGKDLPMDKVAALDSAVKSNVHRQVDLMSRRSDIIKSHVEQKKVQIVSGVFHLKSGKVEWLSGK
jgi:carbonic anhydrase